MHTELKCGFCGNGDLRYVCTLSDRQSVPHLIYLCSDCAALTPDYNCGLHSDDKPAQVNFHEKLWEGTDPQELDALAGAMLGTVEFYEGVLGTEGLICELGAGRGNLTAALKKKGYNVKSCEPSKKLVSRAREHYGLSNKELNNYDAHKFLTKLAHQKRRVKAFFLWHIIEHITHPMEIIQKCKDLLEDDGVIIMQAPMAATPYIFPQHRFFITKSWVEQASKMCGMKAFFCDTSIQEQYISFAWDKVTSEHIVADFGLPSKQTDPLSGWIQDLSNGIFEITEKYKVIKI